MNGNRAGVRGRPITMRAMIWIIVLAVGIACGSPAAEPTGGIQGSVTAGPTCPVETIDSPCPPDPWRGTVRVTAADGSTYEVSTGSDGAYRLALPPGTYEVAPVLDGAGPPFAKPVGVTVGDGFQVIDLHVDSGIR